MHISGAAGHDPEPADVRFYQFRSSCCLAIGGFDLYGSLDALAAVVGRAGELIERERQAEDRKQLDRITAP